MCQALRKPFKLNSKNLGHSKSSKNVITIIITYIISFNLPNSLVRLILFIPILQIKKWRDRLINLFKVI